MNPEWPCKTCRALERGFCDALLHNSDQDPTKAPWQEFQSFDAGDQIVIRGDVTSCVYVMCEGWAFRFFRLSDGQRQILNLLLPGAIFTVASVFEERVDCSVEALTEVQISRFSRTEILSRLPELSKE